MGRLTRGDVATMLLLPLLSFAVCLWFLNAGFRVALLSYAFAFVIVAVRVALARRTWTR